MASLSHSESRRKYSWWWDSHISPKNSKWLQENLTDMDAKVKAMIKLIEEDADSFARRAEMYYKKRPELMKLVEEFYRAYRALAERYDHATVELRQAHRTMAEVFPNQVPYVMPDDPLSSSSSPDDEAQTPQTRHPIYSFLDEDELQKVVSGLASANLHPEESDTRVSRRGLKQFNEMFRSGEVAQERIIRKSLKSHEAAYVNAVEEAETEVQTLKKALAEIQDEKEAAVLQYQQSLEKLCRLERELEDVGGLGERASRAEIEIKVLKEALAKLEAERDAGLLQHSRNTERISVLESMVFQTQKDAERHDERAIKAETEAQSLKQELSALEAEKEAGLFQYHQSLELISTLENKLSHAEENARMLNELSDRAETEIETLKQALSKLKEEKEVAELLYEHCLERIANMEREIFCAQEDVKRLNSEIMIGTTKLRSAEEQCFLLERSNQSLHVEADNLAQKIQVKDEELLEKEDKLQKLQAMMRDEQSQFLQVEATLQALQKLHSKSQEEQKALVLELQNKLQMLKDLEISNHDLQGNFQRVKDENQSLNETNSTSSISIINLKEEISSLKVLKEKLERDVSLQVAHANSLQQEVYNLKEDMENLNWRYQALLEQVHSAGLSPEGLSSSVKGLQEENSRLKEVCRNDRDERGALYEKLSAMNILMEKNVAFESSLSELGGELEGSKEKVKELQDSCHFLQGEKSGLAAEKAILLSQLQMMTENVQKLLEKNSQMENSLCGANVELEGLRTKSKSLEEFSQMLKKDKSCLLNEKSTLVSQLENVEKRLGMLEMRFTRLEEKYSDLEKQKETATNKVNELWSYIGVEKQERSYYIHSSESRLADLESEVHQLQEERKLNKKEFEEELDKAVNAQLEIFILQKFIKDVEEKNSSLFIECQKHVASSKLSDKVISELEAENLEQQVEVEFLLDEIENLRIGVQQVFKALQFSPVNVNEGLIGGEQIPLTQVLDDVEDLKSSLLRNEDERQQLVVENLVLSTLLGESRSEGVELELQKNILEQEYKAFTELHSVQNKNFQELLEMNRQLRLVVSTGEEKEEALKTQLESQSVHLLTLQASYQGLQEENVKELVESRYLLQKFAELKEEMCILEEENSSILCEALALGTLSTVFESSGSEKRAELKALSEDFSSLHLVTNDLKKKVEVLEAKLEMKETETLHLNERIEKLQQELLEGKDLNDDLTYQIIIEKEFLVKKATELLEVEEKLKVSNNANAELSRTIEDLLRECAESKLAKGNFEKQLFELSRDSTHRRSEFEFLREANECLELEVRMLRKEVEEQRAKEENLSLELQERTDESELWEAEASSFYFDLQMSCVHEVLLNDKVHELTAVFESLEEDHATKDTEIEQMRQRFDSSESEIEKLKAHLSAFVPVISSLKDAVDSLEHNSVHQTKCFKDAEMSVQPKKMNRQEFVDDEGSMLRDGISDLLKMQTRIKAVEKAMVEQVDWRAAEKAVVQDMGKQPEREKVKAKGKLDSPVKGTKHLEHRSRSIGESDIKEMELDNKLTDRVKSQKNKPEISDIRSILMKDIPLDQVSDRSIYRRSRSKRASSGTDNQMLELWESAEKNSYFDLMANTQKHEVLRSPKVSPSKFKYARQKSRRRSFELQVEKEVGIDRLEVSTSVIREPKQEGSGGKILERLASDAQKLTALEAAVQELKRQMEMRKRSKKTNNPEFERVNQQLQEVEEAVMQLIGANNKLKRDIEDIQPSSDGIISPGASQKRRFTEQARKRSEKIGRLQFEVQSIQYVLLKLEDEKKSMGKHRFPGSRTGIILRDFISSGRRNSLRRKKARFCGCVRPSANEDERTT